MKNIDIEKLFDKYLIITTSKEDKFNIKKENIYINDSSESYYGQRYIVTSDKLNNKNLYVLRNIYSLEDNRLRYSYDKYINVKIVNTIEKMEDNSEEKLLVVETYEKKETLIGSIGNIRRIDSDKLPAEEKKNNNILKLILKPIKDKKLKEEKLAI